LRRLLGVSGSYLVLVFLGAALAVQPAAGQQARQGLLSLEDARLFYEVIGTGDPIIVVHGGPGLDHQYLQPGLNVLANRNTVIYYDQRGTGRSSAELTEGAINIDTFVQDIDALRQVLGYEQITVLAHSFGALIGIEYAVQYPDNLRSLILMNPVEPGTRYETQTAERMRARSTAADREDMAALTGSEAFTARDPATLGQVYRVAFRQLLRDRSRIDELELDLMTATAKNGQDVAALLGASLQPPVEWWDRLAGIETPTLVLQGRYDGPPLDMGRELAEAFPTGAYEVLSTGHFPYPPMTEEKSPAVRIAIVVTLYVVVAWGVLGVTDWARRMLVLPELFDSLLRGGIVIGLPLAALLAWKYPELGHGDGVDQADRAASHGDRVSQGNGAATGGPIDRAVRPAGRSNTS